MIAAGRRSIACKSEVDSAGRGRGARGHRRAVARCPRMPGRGVFADEPPRVRVEVLDRRRAQRGSTTRPGSRRSRPAPPFDRKGKTFLEAVMLGVGDALRADPRVFVYGEDVGGKYGNAFLLLRPLLEGVRRSHPQLAAGRRRGARRLRRRGARRAAADRRDAVQRLRRDRLQSARQQRREDPLPLGRIGADGGAHAVGRPAPRRSVSQPEHRAVVLPHAGPEDRRRRRRPPTRAR